MKITKALNGNDLTISLSGELNALTAPELETFINEALPGANSLTMDFTECDYVSSAGLRVLLGTFKGLKAEGKSMVIELTSLTLQVTLTLQ